MNQDIRMEIKSNRIYYYELAAELGVSENTIYRHLRSNLTAKQKEQYRSAIERLKQKRYQILKRA